MPGVLGGKALALKNMAQMPSAGSAEYLHPAPIRIRLTTDRTWYLIVETRPTAAGIELILRLEKGSITAPAMVNPLFIESIVLAGEGPFRALEFDDAFFLWREFTPT